MLHFRGLHESNKTDDSADSIAEKLKNMNKTLQYCSDEVRYDLQRNLIQELEILCRRSPLSLAYRKAFREVAESVVESFHGRGQVHVALKRVADNHNHETRENNVWAMGRLKHVFKRNAEADKFLVDRMLARRDDEEQLNLTIWGEYVLGYLDKQEQSGSAQEGFQPDISPA